MVGDVVGEIEVVANVVGTVVDVGEQIDAD